MASSNVKLAGLLVGVVVLGIGCKSLPSWPKNGFLDPSQVGRFSGPSMPQNIQNVVSIKDEPLDIESAREPGPQDLEPVSNDYVIGPGDTVNVVIYELLAEGTESPFMRQVSETGYISLPELGPVKLGGLTFLQAEQRVAELLQQADILRNPRVAVLVIERRHQNFELLGGITRPGTYQVPRPDFRLLDAISLAGDVQPGIETIYVIRAYEPPAAVQSQPVAGQTGAALSAASSPVAGGGVAGMPAGQVAGGASAPATSPLIPRGDEGLPLASQSMPTEAEMAGVLPAGAATQAAAGQPRKLIAVGDQWVEVPAAPETAPATAAASAEAASMPAGLASSPSQTRATTDWAEAITEAGRQRILRIPVRDLMHGDPRYNVVIRTDDRIYAWLGPVGEFYVCGNVFRPGVFSLTGRRVTVRQAVIAAGGLSPLAWPDRCELVRRYNDNQEEIIQLNLDAIFAGTQPDVVLKPNDVLNVGTNAVAPFMATVRNAFRLTYGFGFVYDRNFADIDSYSSKQNPADIRRAQRTSLFGSLFK